MIIAVIEAAEKIAALQDSGPSNSNAVPKKKDSEKTGALSKTAELSADDQDLENKIAHGEDLSGGYSFLDEDP